MFSEQYPFEGETVGEITIRLAGKDVTRPFKVAWKHTPKWEYFDEDTQKLVPSNKSRDAWQTGHQIFADPADCIYQSDPDNPPPEPSWVDPGLLPDGILGIALENAIEEDATRQCIEIDRERRKQSRK